MDKVELKISSTCHRRGYTLRIMGDCQTVSDTFVTKRFYAKRVKWAWEGVYPFFLAFFLASLRRVLTTASGIHTAISRAATCA